MRYLTEEMVAETIQEGRDCDFAVAGPGKLRRKRTYDGIDAVLVLPEREPYVVTGWTEVNCYATALASDRWSLDQLQTIQAFEDQ